MSIVSKIKSNSLLKTGANYSAISSLSSVCTMAIGFLNMRWLGPELLGLWQSLTVINLYLPLLQLGIQSGLNLELPLALGAKDKQRAERLVKIWTCFCHNIGWIVLCFSSHCYLLYVFSRSQHRDSYWVYYHHIHCCFILVQASFYCHIQKC